MVRPWCGPGATASYLHSLDLTSSMNSSQLAGADCFSAGGPQLPAHQPRAAHRAHALHGLVQPHRAAAGCARASIAVWRLFTDLDLSEAKKQRFDSLHDCFTRELKAGARADRPDPAVLTSPCDAIVGACGAVPARQRAPGQGLPVPHRRTCSAPAERRRALRRRQLRHAAPDLGMYHRFHAPHDGRVEHVTYLSGDTWNVNPIALERVRAPVLPQRARGASACGCARRRIRSPLVPVAAILVASIRLHFLDVLLHLR